MDGTRVLLNQRDVDGDEWGLLYENTVTLLGGGNTLYEVGRGVLLDQREVDRDDWGHGGPAG